MNTDVQKVSILPQERFAAMGGIAALLSGGAFVAYFDPSKVHVFPACPLYTLTGFACPGCGLTRGFHALFHGDVAAALSYNALIPVFVILFGYLLLSMVLLAVRGRAPRITLFKPEYLWVFMSAAILFGVLRNLPFYPFSLLFPQ